MPNSNIAAITDGTSNTIAFAERMRGDGDNVKKTKSDIYQPVGIQSNFPTYVMQNPADYANLPKAIQQCDSFAQSNPGSQWNWSGFHWAAGDYNQAVFNFNLTPNSVHFDCSPWGGVATGYGFFTPRSYHSGGVNALFADGSVHFLKDSVAPLTWLALGTRSGSEVIAADAY